MRMLFVSSMCLAAVLANADGVYARFECPNAVTRSQDLRINEDMGETKNKAYLAVRQYPAGAPSKLVKLKLNTRQDSPQTGISFSMSDAKTIQFLCELPEPVQSSPELYAAFLIFVPTETEGSFDLCVWNKTVKVNRIRRFQVKNGEWMFFKMKLNGPKFIEDGEALQGFSIMQNGRGKRSWTMDKIAVWQGKVSAPSPVACTVSASDSENLLAWNIPDSSLPVVKYFIYRGTVNGFTPDSNNMIGETSGTSFRDENIMRPPYFYAVIAEDMAGNKSEAKISHGR